MTLPHLTSVPVSCRAAPHTPRGVVVRQLQRPTCPTRAAPQVRQVRQRDGRRAGKRGNVVSPEPDIDRRFRRRRACRDSGFAECLAPVSDSLAALGRTGGLPTASRLPCIFPWPSHGGLSVASRDNNRIETMRLSPEASSDADCWSLAGRDLRARCQSTFSTI
jgi:hypothetical protein